MHSSVPSIDLFSYSLRDVSVYLMCVCVGGRICMSAMYVKFPEGPEEVIDPWNWSSRLL